MDNSKEESERKHKEFHDNLDCYLITKKEMQQLLDLGFEIATNPIMDLSKIKGRRYYIVGDKDSKGTNKMKTIVAGSRDISDYSIVKQAIIESKFNITEIVSGTAKGVDTLGEQYAIEHGIPIKKFPPDWGKFGRSAGPKRNLQMAEYADALVAVWDGKSRGTGNMIENARRLGLEVFIYLTNDSVAQRMIDSMEEGLEIIKKEME